MDDAEAVKRLREGDRDGAAYLVEKYQMDVYNVSLRILGNPADAEDASQDALLLALQRIASYRPDRPLRPWLRAIARNRALDLLRHRLRAPELAPEPSPSVEGTALGGIEAARIRQALDSLTTRERILLVLRYWEDQPVASIAEAMGMSEPAVRVALLRARRALGRLLVHEESGVAL